MSGIQISRRYFFMSPLLALASGSARALGATHVGSVPSLKAGGYKSLNETLNIAAVGIGGRGAQNLSGLLSENIVALCDVDARQGAPTFKRFEKATRHTDFRRMLDKNGKDIDAVVISTADHMHATIALWCMERGKHVYVEKPLTRTPWEAHLLAEAAAKYQVATQMGNQGYSHEAHRTACEIIWSGEIGNVTEVHAVTSSPNWPQAIQSIPPEEPVPPGLDWDLWLGCAAMRPYTSGGWDKDHIPDGRTGPYNGSNYGFYVPHDWRGFYDFGTGSLGMRRFMLWARPTRRYNWALRWRSSVSAPNKGAASATPYMLCCALTFRRAATCPRCPFIGTTRRVPATPRNTITPRGWKMRCSCRKRITWRFADAPTSAQIAPGVDGPSTTAGWADPHLRSAAPHK